MCGIFGIVDWRGEPGAAREIAVRGARLLRHRGPDWSGVFQGHGTVLAHERLAIVDVLHGAQPLLSDDGRWALAVNGEIYNHAELRARRFAGEVFCTDSDCEVLLPIVRGGDGAALRWLRGMFAFVAVEASTGRWFAGRDPIGIIPLYWGQRPDGSRMFASELKALIPFCETIAEFLPGHWASSESPTPREWSERPWAQFEDVEDRPFEPSRLKEALSDSVRCHLMSDVPYGVLLSGGLDSSVIAALACAFSERRVESSGGEKAWWPRVHSFAIGLEGSPDLAASQRVADALGTVHHAFRFTIDEGIDALRDVIWHIESFDVTTVRASTPMYLMARRIKAMGVKMVLSGEGSDEIFGGYLYFHKAPNPQAFHEELVRKLSALHLFDCLRANKSMAAWGVEARVPFLDTPFINHAMSIHARHKMAGQGRIEKHILREAFEGMLPPEILWRQKEQFSDGVGYQWIDSLKAHAAARVSDAAFAAAAESFEVGTPLTKEAYLYRSIFAELFPHRDATACVPCGPSVACSTPAALQWDPSLAQVVDPSGRAVRGVHQRSL
jgi:asparagine synthase (glutamine-hydrolysing)